MQEYLDLGHTKMVPVADMEKLLKKVFYIPMHAVYKTSSTTTKIRAVFDASAKSSTGVSLNDVHSVGPTVHPPVIDVLLRFQLYPVALTADISIMYCAVELAMTDQDLHHFVWRSDSKEPLRDYQMTRVNLESQSPHLQNAIHHAHNFPSAAKVVESSFYVDCLTGAADPKLAVTLQQELSNVLSNVGFLL